MAALAFSIDEARRAEIEERPFMDTGDPSSFENVQRINVPRICPTSQPYMV
jgi:hypothetical protein